MSMLGSATDTVSSSSWPILFKVLMLSVVICTMLLHLSNLSLSSVADFLNTGARAPTSAERALSLSSWKVMWFGYMVWVSVMVIFRWLYFYLIKDILATVLLSLLCWSFAWIHTQCLSNIQPVLKMLNTILGCCSAFSYIEHFKDFIDQKHFLQ